jgi:hypothetical protein
MTVSSSDAENVLDTELQADGVHLLKLNVPEAQVKLRPHDENRVHVRGFVLRGQSNKSTQDQSSLSTVSTRHSDERLHIFRQGLSRDVSDWRHRIRHRTTIHLDIRLPPHLDVTAQVCGGAINAASLAGSLELTVHGGSVQVEQIDGSLHLQGSGGSLIAQEVSGSSLEVQWAAGPVTLKQITDAKLALEARGAPTTVQDHRGPADLRVHGAPLTLTDLDGRCDGVVHGNSLTYHGAPTHETSLQTVGGPVQMHLPPAHSASLTLAGAHVALDDDFAFEGKKTSRRIEGTLNGEGPNLALRAIEGRASCHIQNDA